MMDRKGSKLNIEKLRSEYESIPPNQLIAKPFFLKGYIENWGTGTSRMVKLLIANIKN